MEPQPWKTKWKEGHVCGPCAASESLFDSPDAEWQGNDSSKNWWILCQLLFAPETAMRSSETLSVVSGDLGCRGQKKSDFIGKPNKGVICGRGREEGDEESKDVILSFQSHLCFFFIFNINETPCLGSSLDTTWHPWTFGLWKDEESERTPISICNVTFSSQEIPRQWGKKTLHILFLPPDPRTISMLPGTLGSHPAATTLNSGLPCFQDLCF